MKKSQRALLMLVATLFIFSSCAKKESQYSEAERNERLESAQTVVTAIFQKKADLKNGKIDYIDGRSGKVIRHVEKAITFKVKSVLKGKLSKKEITLGCSNPVFDFGITPGEIPGRKLYTFYLKKGTTYDSDILSGVEWKEVQP